MNRKSVRLIRASIVLGSLVFLLAISLTTETTTPLSEGFEVGGKTSYAAANVTLGTG